MKILILGDSFCASLNDLSWSVKLGKIFPTVNLSQSGCTQYHILKQLESVSIDDFTFIIVCHTSPYRIYTRQHPIHTSGTHINSGLLLNDIDYHSKKISNCWNKSLHAAKNFIKYHYSEQYQLDIYNLIKNKISSTISKIDNIEMSGCEADEFGLRELYLNNQGTINHLTAEANQVLLDKILKKVTYGN